MKGPTVMIKFLILGSVLLLAAPACSAQVSVFVWQENRPDDYVFHYRVVNNSRNAVVGVSLGLNADTNQSQLTVDPKGVDYEAESSDSAIGLLVSSLGATAPPGWQTNLIVTEEAEKAHMYFRLMDPTAALGKNQMIRGFVVITPTLDALYRTGSFAALLDNGATLTGRLEPDELDAPAPSANAAGGGTICATSESVMLTAALTGNGPWSLTWSDGVVTRPGAPNATRSVSPTGTAAYSVTAISDVNRYGSSSGTAPVTVGAPVIETHPQSVTIPARSSTTLSVAVFPTDATYQWFKGSTGETKTKVGTNSSSFVTPVLRATTSYWVRVTNRCSFTNSNTAVVTVP